MFNDVKRVYVEKKKGFDVEAKNLFSELRDNLRISELEETRILNRYDVSGLTEDEFALAVNSIFSENNVDKVYKETFNLSKEEQAFAVEYLPGQYDQRADSALQCIQLINKGKIAEVKSSKVIILKGKLRKEDIEKVKRYYINPVDTRESSMDKPQSIHTDYSTPTNVEYLQGFISLSQNELAMLHKNLNLAMSLEDLTFCQQYFQNEEKRDPSITEIKVLDTYWSDHCRHTTFLTEIQNIKIEEDKFNEPLKNSYKDYLKSRELLYKNGKKAITLMDIATIAMKELKIQGKLTDLDESEEINACSIRVPVVIDGKEEIYLVMFKNETHNHPTEIEPFGGAATCLGGAIRDPLSGRAYVYQAMRVTGSGDPRSSIENTLPGKLPQKKITTGAAHGYSSYGNQIGLSTGLVTEIYHEGYVAKRMEIGAVIAAVPEENVRREVPISGDKIILLGGRTGRDGCGGATGSSKKHTEESLVSCGAEVQKGNATTERKIQRLFRNREVSCLIKRCNDFGAGGVSVAIGELADGLIINLDTIPKKYDGLDGTELAISESQERMAVVVGAADIDKFITLANKENLEATVAADVTDDERLVMLWKGNEIVNISRKFLNTNGAKSYADIYVNKCSNISGYFKASEGLQDINTAWLNKLRELNICGQKGLSERFDSTIGAGTVLMPFGGKYQLTPSEVMACKIPVLTGETNTATLMSHGFNPDIAKLSPYHGAVYAVVESVSKIVAAGGNYKNIKLTFQEYFERLGNDPERWGKPFSALLGAYQAQKTLGIAAIGGKDSMSGSFNDLDVPPTLVSFAVDSVKDSGKIVSQEFKETGNRVILFKTKIDEYALPDFDALKKNYEIINSIIDKGYVKACHSIRYGGICEAISKMTFGNKVGFVFSEGTKVEDLFIPSYGSFILEIDNSLDFNKELIDCEFSILGHTTYERAIILNGSELPLDTLIKAWTETLEDVFPSETKDEVKVFKELLYEVKKPKKCNVLIGAAAPRVFIPVFPGTNCEYDSKRAFEKAGGNVTTLVFRNLSAEDIEDSVLSMEKEIRKSQILMLPGGFSAGDEPEGSGKFIANVFRNPILKEAVMDLLKNRDGLILGICNGFQALIKLGLVPYGEIIEVKEDFPTLTFNNIGRHVSCLVNTKVVSNLSPWFNNVKVGDMHKVAVSHGEGRFVGNEDIIKKLFKNGQVSTQYVDMEGNAVSYTPYNPNGSMYAIEGITSQDGRVLGKMAHSERVGNNVHKNISGEKNQGIFEAGIKYFK